MGNSSRTHKMKLQPAADPSAQRAVALTNARLRLAEQHLLKSDRVMAKLVPAHGHCKLGARGFQPFHALTTSIISQQLSAKAAATIAARIALLAPRPFEPGPILAIAVESLRSAGLSSAKARYILELARRVEDG